MIWPKIGQDCEFGMLTLWSIARDAALALKANWPYTRPVEASRQVRT